jgi:hypothetical protein
LSRYYTMVSPTDADLDSNYEMKDVSESCPHSGRRVTK